MYWSEELKGRRNGWFINTLMPVFHNLLCKLWWMRNGPNMGVNWLQIRENRNVFSWHGCELDCWILEQLLLPHELSEILYPETFCTNIVHYSSYVNHRIQTRNNQWECRLLVCCVQSRSCRRSNTLFQKSLILFLTWREYLLYLYSQPTHFSSQPKK